jgi:hypothetical protein
MNGEDALPKRPPSKLDPAPLATERVQLEANPQAAPPEETKTSEIDEWGLPMKQQVQTPSPKPIETFHHDLDEKSKLSVAASQDEKNLPNDSSQHGATIRLKENDEETQVNSDPKPKAEILPLSADNKSDKRVSNPSSHFAQASEWSHQHLAPNTQVEDKTKSAEEDWQVMPAYAPFDIYNDDGKLIAHEAVKEDEEADFGGFENLGGAAKGYTRVQMDEDAQSATSMDENTAYLFKEPTTNVLDDEDSRDAQAQMQTTKTLLTETQKIAYVGIVRLAMIEMIKDLSKLEKSKGSKKIVEFAIEHMTLWSQMIMLRLYSHMEIESAGIIFHFA